MSEMAQTVLLLFIALVFLVWGYLNLRGRFVDALPAGEDEDAKAKGPRQARAVGYFAVSLFCIWRAFYHEPLGGTVFGSILTAVVIHVFAAHAMVVPFLKWYRRRRDTVVRAQIIVEAVAFLAFFLFALYGPEKAIIRDFGDYFLITMFIVFLVICLYPSRRFGLSVAIVLGMLIPAVIPVEMYPYVIPVRVAAVILGAASANGVDFLIGRFLNKQL